MEEGGVVGGVEGGDVEEECKGKKEGPAHDANGVAHEAEEEGGEEEANEDAVADGSEGLGIEGFESGEPFVAESGGSGGFGVKGAFVGAGDEEFGVVVGEFWGHAEGGAGYGKVTGDPGGKEDGDDGKDEGKGFGEGRAAELNGYPEDDSGEQGPGGIAGEDGEAGTEGGGGGGKGPVAEGGGFGVAFMSDEHKAEHEDGEKGHEGGGESGDAGGPDGVAEEEEADPNESDAGVEESLGSEVEEEAGEEGEEQVEGDDDVLFRGDDFEGLVAGVGIADKGESGGEGEGVEGRVDDVRMVAHPFGGVAFFFGEVMECGGADDLGLEGSEVGDVASELSVVHGLSVVEAVELGGGVDADESEDEKEVESGFDEFKSDADVDIVDEVLDDGFEVFRGRFHRGCLG